MGITETINRTLPDLEYPKHEIREKENQLKTFALGETPQGYAMVQKAKEIAKETGAIMIHAFDDPQIIAAQGVIGLEILDDLPDVDEIYLPIGGGGLAAGTLIAIKEKNPQIKVIGVQSKSFPSMYDSVKQGSITSSGGERTIADGISVKVPGQLTFTIIKELIDEIVLVDDVEITKAMFLLMERMKFVVEPAGGSSLAYLI